MVVKTKHFQSPDQPTLEQVMNVFLATLAVTAIMDVQMVAVEGKSKIHYVGMVIYQG